MKKIECDGCGKSQEIPVSGIYDRPKTVRHFAVKVEREDGEAQDWHWDLCDSCHEHLLQGMDPSRWARAKPFDAMEGYTEEERRDFRVISDRKGKL